MVPQTPAGPPGSQISAELSRYSPEWQIALDRVMLYLRAYEIPSLIALEVAHDALQQAQDDGRLRSSQHPASAAMRAAISIVASRKGGGTDSVNAWDAEGDVVSYARTAVPPLRRGSMGARRNWHRPWLDRMASILRRSRWKLKDSGSLMAVLVAVLSGVLSFIVAVRAR